MRRWLKRLLILAIVLVVVAAAPIVWIETACMSGTPSIASDYRPILEPAHHRNEIDSYLTYPEWSVVHAYEDFAAVARARGETAFGYIASVTGFWSNLCAISAYASARGTVSADVRAMLYIIGTSFSAEMGVKGLYESTLGRVTEAIRGNELTAEDRFALSVADDYAKFLRQTPWYEYPFGATLGRFWSTEVPWTGGNYVRKIERRIGLSIEYGVKAIYAQVIAVLAGLAPAPLAIRSVVRGLDETDLVVDGRIQLVKAHPGEIAVIETPRYREFTEILAGLSGRGRDMIEIAGNDDIFVTVLLPPGFEPPAGETLISVPLQSRVGWRRVGLAIKVNALAGLIRQLATTPARLEHVYDY